MSRVRTIPVLVIGLLAFLLLLSYVYIPDFVATDSYMKALVPATAGGEGEMTNSFVVTDDRHLSTSAGKTYYT